MCVLVFSCGVFALIANVGVTIAQRYNRICKYNDNRLWRSLLVRDRSAYKDIKIR